MSETNTLAKIVIFLGAVFLLIGTLSPGADAAYTTFSSSIQNFPTFNNPFSAKSFTFQIAGDWKPNSVSTTPLNVRGYKATITGKCLAQEYPVTGGWYDCLNKADGNATYETTGFGGFSTGIAVNLSAFTDSGSFAAIMVSITYQCKSHGSGVTFEFYDGTTTFLAIGDQIGQISCHKIGTLANDDSNQFPGYTNYTLSSDVTLASITPANGARGIGGSRFILRNGGAIGSDDLLFFSYASITVTYQRISGCKFTPSGNPWDDVSRATFYVGCIIGALGGFFVDGITFIINVLIFFGQIVFYFINFVVQLISVFAYLLSSPGGMPPILQGIISVIVIGCIVFIAISILGKVRGSGAGA